MSAAGSSSPRLVPALAVDAAELAVLHARCFDDPWQAELIARVLGTPGGFGLLARPNGEPIGFILCRSAAGEGEILTFCVDPALRGCGLGRQLLAAAIAEAGKRQLVALFLEVAEDNEIARGLYDNHGFVQVGLRPAYYRLPSGQPVDALTLRLVLQPRIERD
ncbi:MAG: ribosomal-protein-alanine N-acetyltransferase [Alphaproteobacteria bacterium]|nr:ribosomal-protein-alanine N-acetyltransferase [Alphaproteobacteria bacterium]